MPLPEQRHCWTAGLGAWSLSYATSRGRADLVAQLKEAKPVWVTGAGGFIGLHLSRFLAGKGHHVLGFGRSEAPGFAAATGGAFFSGGVTARTLDAALAAHGRPAAVYHLAGGATVGQSIADPLKDFEQSVVSAACVLDFLRRHAPDASVVLASSAAVYGGGHFGPIRVDAALDPYSPYGYHKRMVEELGRSYCGAYGQLVSVARLFSVYGEGLRKQLLWDLCGRLAAGETDIVLGGTGTEMRDWHHVSDVVRLIHRILPAGEPRFAVYNGGAGAPASVSTISRMVLEAWGGNHRLSFSGKSRRGDPVNLISDPSGVPDGLQLQVPLIRGIAGYVDWYRAEILAEPVGHLRRSAP
ncbi:MAG: SDR family oxidoreductase [Mesorhizobium sp.]|nr:MAG: SDR family oxidoreductase [Mesorhizobium sp.]RWK67266.1 MAG: SDR family oxidoreductase [Mesorhizobium sp.]RWK72741.1 MAG: SDR family oxidoreductase [Mesorhizobium sp.]RWK77834.1 MAG: SDR family oxidoreductase [Mesorhizobium sp.]RWL02262.1 MAG: SDR family oxidoreductase [Mesorhizobium sp.]